MKLKAFIIDGDRIEEYKGNYDPDDQIIEIKRKRGVLRKKTVRFQVVSSHIKPLHNSKGKFKGYCVHLDAKKRMSVKLPDNGDDPVDQEVRNTLDYLVDKANWEGRRARGKISTTTFLTILFAGYGILRFLEWMIFYIMQAR